MNWERVLLLCCLAAVALLALLSEGEGAAVRSPRAAGPEEKEGLKKRVFMKGSDASSFFRKRGKRSPKAQGEINAENRQRLSADEQRREYHEEQRNEFENYVEEEQDEQQERTREQVEQWRQWHYDGLYPSYHYQRHNI
ncbi:unique cartilage matrix-associated protein [Ambystoma mexicanum]|uniref:unique cartilage matrix-associated protein n=1 Tax=Ambystoma mexicanum TaxID=8296 RepID=UPI0037E88FC7